MWNGTGQMGAKDCKRLRELAAGLGMSLAEEGKLKASSRKQMFEMEVSKCLASTMVSYI